MKFFILSPATEVKPLYITGAVEMLRSLGHEVTEGCYARGPRCGTFAAADDRRLADLVEAVTDPSVDVILCARGGYGCVHLLSPELEALVRQNPKWLVGFSDVSALHALWLRAGAPSLHASMAKQLALYAPEERSAEVRDFLQPELGADADLEGLRLSANAMLDILGGCREVEYTCEPIARLNAPAEVSGEVVCGNFAVLNGLASTPWDVLTADYLRGKILILEDVGEKIYRIERMLTRLHLSGALDSVAALLFGTFTDYLPDRNYPDMEAMLADRLHRWGVRCPVVMGLPIGHQARNLPIPEGWRAKLTLPSEGKLTLSLTAPCCP